MRRQLIERSRERLLGAESATSTPEGASLFSGPTGGLARKLLETLKVDAATHLDDLIPALEEHSPSEMIAALFELEVEGLVKQLPGKYFVKVW